MSLTNISAYRIAGFKFSDDDFDPNAEIETSKLGTRTLTKTFPAITLLPSGAGVITMNSGVFGGMIMPDANTSTLKISFKVPHEWTSGNITLKILWNTTVTSGNLRLVVTYTTIKNGENLSSVTQTVIQTDAAKGTTLLLNEISFVLTGTNFEAGDNVGLTVLRDPADAGDTLGSNANIFALSLEFTGRG